MNRNIHQLLAVMVAAGVMRSELLGGQQPTKKMEEPIIVRGVIREPATMDWGPQPPGTPHSARVRSYDLQHQIVRVAFDWSRHAVVGSTTLRIAALDKPLDRVQLDAVGMTIKAVKDAAGADLAHDYDDRVLTIRLPHAIAPGVTTSLTVEYESVRPKVGVYFVDRRHVVWTQGKLEDNRYWVPTYDFPNDKATWELFVKSAANERAFGTGSLRSQRPLGDGIEWHWVQQTPSPTYLMTVAVGPYAKVEESVGAVRLGYWAYADSLNAARSGFAVTPKIVDFLARKLGTPFPSATFDQVVVPDFIFWDWLESWRPLIAATVQDERLILRGSSGWPGEDREMAIARAVAQEWFGKLVTPADWSHVWLSDGIANFLAQVYAQETHIADDAFGATKWSHVSTFAADRDARRPLVYDRWQYGPMELLLTEHVGQKGAVVLWMLHRELGDSVFWAGMRRYLAQHANANATSSDFQRAMEQASGWDLTTFFRQWVYGAGFPFLRVAFQYDAKTKRITFTAEQYQQRDAMTGYFDASVDVEVLTDAGPVRGRVPLHGAHSTFELPLPSAPRSLRWDPDDALPSRVELRRPTEMLVYQLEHHPDPAAREEALEELGPRAMGMEGEGVMAFSVGSAPMPRLARPELTAPMLRAAKADASRRVRAKAIAAVGFRHMFNPDVANALLDLTHDREPAIRAVAAQSLFGPPEPRVMARLQDMAKTDPDASVREAVSQTLSMLPMAAPGQTNALAKQKLESPNTPDDERARYLAMSANFRDPDAWNIARRYLTDPTSGRSTLQAAMRSLGMLVFMSRVAPGPDSKELVALIAPFLDAYDPSLRIAAAREIGNAKVPDAKAALEARKRKEADARVLRAIDAAIAESGKPEPGMPRRRE